MLRSPAMIGQYELIFEFYSCYISDTTDMEQLVVCSSCVGPFGVTEHISILYIGMSTIAIYSYVQQRWTLNESCLQ
jgi:hypothetical protein